MLEKARHNKYPSNLTSVEKSGKNKAMSDEKSVYRGIKEYICVLSTPYQRKYLKNLSEDQGNIVSARLSNLEQKSNK